jgi:branched-chain amino acid transport system ATP-binding protein
MAKLGLARTHQVVKPLDQLTVRENAMVGACFGHQNHRLATAAQIADEMLAFVGLADRAAQLAASLNLAQKKRLELARALSAQPYLLLLDETLAGLNPAEIDAMLETIRKIQDRGITIIMIEHVMHAIMTVCEHILVLNFGALIAQGSPQEIADDEQVIEAYLGDPGLAERLMQQNGDEG